MFAISANSQPMVELDLKGVMETGDMKMVHGASPHSLFVSSSSYHKGARALLHSKFTHYNETHGMEWLWSGDMISGRYCAFKVGRGWMRAILWKVGERIYTFNIDNGDFRGIERRSPMKLPLEILRIPRLTVEVGLSDVKPIDGRCWGSKEQELLAEYGQGRIEFIQKGTVEGVPVGEVILSTGQTLNRLLLRTGLAIHTHHLDKIYPILTTLA